MISKGLGRKKKKEEKATSSRYLPTSSLKENFFKSPQRGERKPSFDEGEIDTLTLTADIFH